MTKTICNDCKSEIVNSFAIIEGPNGEVCSDCFEKNFKKKLKNTLLKLVTKEKANMSNISENLLDDAIEWIRENLRPEEVFEEDELKSWAEKMGMKRRY